MGLTPGGPASWRYGMETSSFPLYVRIHVAFLWNFCEYHAMFCQSHTFAPSLFFTPAEEEPQIVSHWFFHLQYFLFVAPFLASAPAKTSGYRRASEVVPVPPIDPPMTKTRSLSPSKFLITWPIY